MIQLTLSIAPQEGRMWALHPFLEFKLSDQPVARIFVFSCIYALMHLFEIDV